MTTFKTFRAAAVAAGFLFGTAGTALADSIVPTYTTFGTLAAATFGGSGIPNDAVAITTFENGDDTITLGLTAHQRFFNDPVLNDGMGSFTAKTGANFGDPDGPGPSSTLGATWNFGFYVEIDGPGTIGSYAVELLYDLDPGAGTDDGELGIIDFNTVLSGGLSGLSLVEGSENPLFNYLSAGDTGVTPPTVTPFDPFASGEYSFALRVSTLDTSPTLLGEAAINVNVVPEPATLAILGVGLAGLGAFRRKRRA